MGRWLQGHGMEMNHGKCKVSQSLTWSLQELFPHRLESGESIQIAAWTFSSEFGTPAVTGLLGLSAGTPGKAVAGGLRP